MLSDRYFAFFKYVVHAKMQIMVQPIGSAAHYTMFQEGIQGQVFVLWFYYNWTTPKTAVIF